MKGYHARKLLAFAVPRVDAVEEWLATIEDELELERNAIRVLAANVSRVRLPMVVLMEGAE